jgi:hypothetical protein
MRMQQRDRLIICPHQDHFIAAELAEARAIGAHVKLTERERSLGDIFSIASVDATKEESRIWETRFVLWLVQTSDFPDQISPTSVPTVAMSSPESPFRSPPLAFGTFAISPSALATARLAPR